MKTKLPASSSSMMSRISSPSSPRAVRQHAGDEDVEEAVHHRADAGVVMADRMVQAGGEFQRHVGGPGRNDRAARPAPVAETRSLPSRRSEA